MPYISISDLVNFRDKKGGIRALGHGCFSRRDFPRSSNLAETADTTFASQGLVCKLRVPLSELTRTPSSDPSAVLGDSPELHNSQMNVCSGRRLSKMSSRLALSLGKCRADAVVVERRC